jgi:hypothetical protein
MDRIDILFFNKPRGDFQVEMPRKRHGFLRLKSVDIGREAERSGTNKGLIPAGAFTETNRFIVPIKERAGRT